MIRLTTPQHHFTFYQDAREFSKILVSYEQYGKIVLEKTKADMTIDPILLPDGETVYDGWYVLSQEETSLFSAGANVKIQVRAKTSGGDVYASEEFSVPVFRVINDDIL